MRPACVAILGALLAGCATADGGGTTRADDPVVRVTEVRLEDPRWQALSMQMHVLETRLPPILARFESRDTRQWHHAKEELQADPALWKAVTPNLEGGDPDQQSALLWCTDRDKRGARAREQLAFLGRVYAAAAGFRSPEPEHWDIARERLSSLGPRGVDSAAIAILLRMKPPDLPVRLLQRWQRQLALCGPGALRVLRIAFTRMNWLWMERILPPMAAMGEPAGDMLVEMLDHPNEAVVRNALRALEKIPTAKAVPRLEHFLSPAQPWRARAMAILALAAAPAPESGRLIAGACGDPDPFVSRTAAQATGRFYRANRGPSDTEAAAAVRELLKLIDRTGEDYRDARRAALDSLRLITRLRRGQRKDFEAWLAG